ncbi:MAG: hypothetical protein ACXVXC_12400 [Nocardioidaceae bacterium]
MHLDLPSTVIARSAYDVAATYHSTAMLNHCTRSYLWAAALAEQRAMEADHELLCVASMLHDLGLVAAFDSHTVPFEEAGGHVAWVFGAGAGWPVGRRRRTAEIIVRHMWDEVDPAQDPEGYLLGVATGLDTSGRNAEWWPADLRAAVVAAYPRGGLRAEFVAWFESQAARKPGSAAAGAVASGIADRMERNVLEQATHP